MAIEAAVSLSAAWLARSPALLAFGGDSAIELISAVVVLRRFQVPGAYEKQSRALPALPDPCFLPWRHLWLYSAIFIWV